MISKNLKQYAQDISQITFDMEKVCRTKEDIFCNSINVTSVEFRCLRYLLKSSFTLVKDLATDMDLTPPRVTTLLNSLEKKAYLTREVALNDRRVVKVNLTENGKIFAKDISKRYVKFHENLLSLMKDENQIKEILENLKCFQQTLEIFLENKKDENEGK